MQIKTVRGYHFTPTRMAKIQDNPKSWQGCGEIGIFIFCWCEFKMVQLLWKTVQQFLKKLNTTLPYDSEIILLGRIKQLKTYVHMYVDQNMNVHSSIFMIVRMRKRPDII